MCVKVALVLAALIGSLLAGEVGLRAAMPLLGADLTPPPGRPSPFRYDARIRYELKPFALVDAVDDEGRAILERMNSDGFRGREYAIPKPAGTFRILVVGDSVVQGLTVSYAQTWEQVLERLLNRRAAAPSLHYEVINAGIGGYVSRQALVRLVDRGLKYQPDLVLVLVGWNDLVFSSVPSWTPAMDLTRFEQAFAGTPAADDSRRGWRLIRHTAYRLSYVARLVRQARNSVYNARRIQALIAQRQVDSGVPFNDQALRMYLANLERIHEAITTRGARLGVIVWPTILSPELLDDAEVHQRLVPIYSNFPLSTGELWAWYDRYAGAQQRFAARHAGVILVDAQRRMQGIPREARLRVFADLAHLTVEGNRVLAQIALAGLAAAGIVPGAPP